MFLIIGLGNPGVEYERTRHNLGFRVIDRLCQRWGDLRLRETARYSVFVRVKRAGRDLVLAKPLTYMNRSGLAVAELLGLFAAQPDEAVVIYDDNALPVGNIRIRPGGGSGGHKGIGSVIEAMGTEAVPRVRLGIGVPPGDGVDHVLSSFDGEELPRIEESIDVAADAVEVLLAEGIEAAMNRFNRTIKGQNGEEKEQENAPGGESE